MPELPLCIGQIGGMAKFNKEIAVVLIVIIGFSLFVYINIEDKRVIEQSQPAVDEHIADWMHKVTQLADCSDQNISYAWNTPVVESTDYEFFQVVFTVESSSIQNLINDVYALATSVHENSAPGLNPHMIIVDSMIEDKLLSVTLLADMLPEKAELEHRILQKWQETQSTRDPIIMMIVPEEHPSQEAPTNQS